MFYSRHFTPGRDIISQDRDWRLLAVNSSVRKVRCRCKRIVARGEPDPREREGTNGDRVGDEEGNGNEAAAETETEPRTRTIMESREGEEESSGIVHIISADKA